MLGGFMEDLTIDSGLLEPLVDQRYTLANINKVAYKVITHKVGSDETILACTSLTIGDLKRIKTGNGSIELLERACGDLFFQFIYAYGANGIQARIKTPFHVYRLTP